MGVRRRGRELALQALYQVEFCGDDPSRTVAAFWERCDAAPEARAFGAALVYGVLAERARIDGLIGGASEHWRLGRISTVDLNVLRIGTYELACSPEVPPSVVIDEAIEIAKRYGSDDSATFVNGVLDQVAAALGVKAKHEGAR